MDGNCGPVGRELAPLGTDFIAPCVRASLPAQGRRARRGHGAVGGPRGGGGGPALGRGGAARGGGGPQVGLGPAAPGVLWGRLAGWRASYGALLLAARRLLARWAGHTCACPAALLPAQHGLPDAAAALVAACRDADLLQPPARGAGAGQQAGTGGGAAPGELQNLFSSGAAGGRAIRYSCEPPGRLWYLS